MRILPKLAIVSTAVASASISACGREDMGKPITEPLKLADGREISIQQLLHGQEQYMLYCRPCHGDNGDGRGPAGIGLRPPPRDFTDPVFKFGGVEAGNLPPDAELMRIVKGGLNGTAMLPWDVQDKVIEDIIQYIKTFSPIWKEDEVAPPIEITDDPWASKTEEGIARGKKVYHGLAQCLQCHPAYATKQEIYDFSKELTGNPITTFRPEMYEPEAKESSAFKHKLLPPDFARHDIRSGHLDAGQPVVAVRDLFRTIGSGIGGTAMPMWKGSLPDDDVWAIAHFVNWVAQMKGKPEYAALRKQLKEAPEWVPPPPPPEEGAVPAEGAAPAPVTP